MAWLSPAVVLGAVLLWGTLSVGLLLSVLSAPDMGPEAAAWAQQLMRSAMMLLAERWPLLLVALLPVLMAAAWLGWWAHRHWLAEPQRVAEAARALAQSDATGLDLRPRSAVGRELLRHLEHLSLQRKALQADVDAQIAVAAQRLETERSRLAALMAELTQSVVVCNRDGRIILYNQRARMQFRALSLVPGGSHGAELLGIGRSIYAVFDARLVQHALAHISRRLARGAHQPHAQFVTHTRGGQLLRVVVAPVRAVPAAGAHVGLREAVADAGRTQSGIARAAAVGQGPCGVPGTAAGSELAGFVLMLDNLTQAVEAETRLDRQVLQWLQSARAMASRIRLAAANPTADEVMQQAQRLDALLGDALAQWGKKAPSRWPLEDVLAEDWLALVMQRLSDGPSMRVQLEPLHGQEAARAWLRLDSFAMLQVVQSLVQRLADEFGVAHVRLRLAVNDGRAWLDVIFSGRVVSTETVMTWELDPMCVDGQTLPTSVRDVLNRHGAQLWFERDRPRHEAFFRLELPLAQEPQPEVAPPPPVWNEGRPEFYDFDLFQRSPQVQAMEDQPLQELVYTVFDTETTGLHPRQGDAIVQIGATRVVNLRVRRTEVFDQLVDPQRPIPAPSVCIHGITPEMVRGQPTIAEVLPAFVAFAHDSVLVAHNAAFDMAFLEVQGQRLGIRMTHPVLDTLLLAAVVFPNQDSNRLDALAERFGLTIQGRHTALGDALVTAEIFVRLIPLLALRGIHTLRQAREASEATSLARLKY